MRNNIVKETEMLLLASLGEAKLIYSAIDYGIKTIEDLRTLMLLECVGEDISKTIGLYMLTCRTMNHSEPVMIPRNHLETHAIAEYMNFKGKMLEIGTKNVVGEKEFRELVEYCTLIQYSLQLHLIILRRSVCPILEEIEDPFTSNFIKILYVNKIREAQEVLHKVTKLQSKPEIK